MPGKPTLLAAVKGQPIVGIPGYPVSAVISFREFVRPLLFQIQGLQAPDPEKVEAFMGRKLPSKPGLEEHVRVILGKVGERVIAIPLAGGAGMMTSLVRADGILRSTVFPGLWLDPASLLKGDLGPNGAYEIRGWGPCGVAQAGILRPFESRQSDKLNFVAHLSI